MKSFNETFTVQIKASYGMACGRSAGCAAAREDDFGLECGRFEQF